MGCDTAVAPKMTEPANPAPKVAMPAMTERRSLKADSDSRFSSFLGVVSASHLRLSNRTILDPLLQPKITSPHTPPARVLLLK
jgi:hypothetical protein